ncbi:hypothetical protein [Streptomyces sp. NPDC021224]|uniref:hypothetical protein n=1 Tax=unclassified Streptomyces TaxID=2593676 RepID=UPI0037B7D5AD
MPTGTSSSEPVRRPRAGRPATPGDLARALHRDRLLRSELDRVRSAAVAWRNGLGALLAGLIGFGLIRGRSDIGELTPTTGVWVGVLLLAALLVGATGGLMLLRAAHGHPHAVATARLPPAAVLDHQEAVTSARLLRAGTAATLTCAALLAAGVALTWYGPSRAESLQIEQSDGTTLCGQVIRAADGTLVLHTPSGDRTVDLRATVGLRAVPSC